MRIILCGFGVVAQSLAKLLESRSAELYSRYGLKPRIIGVFDSKGTAIDNSGLKLKKLIDAKKKTASVRGYDKSLKQISGPFDMAFIDADKENYSNYYEAILPLIRSGGLMAIDNVLWSGRVLDPKDKSDKAIHQLNERVIRDERVESVLLTVRDGLNCIVKN